MKFLVLSAYGKHALRRAKVIHVLTSNERVHLHNVIGNSDNIVIVPNGVDIPRLSHAPSVTLPLSLMYLGRLHKKKNIEVVIDAYKEVFKKNGTSTPSLHVYGWGEEPYVNSIKALVKQYQLNDKVFLHGPIFGKEKESALLKHDIFILPSLGEGFPLAVIEAMSHGQVCIISEYCNLDFELENQICLNSGIKADDVAKSIIKVTQKCASKLAHMKRMSHDHVKKYYKIQDVVRQVEEKMWKTS